MNKRVGLARAFSSKETAFCSILSSAASWSWLHWRDFRNLLTFSARARTAAESRAGNRSRNFLFVAFFLPACFRAIRQIDWVRTNSLCDVSHILRRCFYLSSDKEEQAHESV